jgi:hypothetical protein
VTDKILTPLVLMQQIVVLVQVVVDAGPQTLEAPDPVQQYGLPELQMLFAMGCCPGPVLVGHFALLFPVAPGKARECTVELVRRIKLIRDSWSCIFEVD